MYLLVGVTLPVAVQLLSTLTYILTLSSLRSTFNLNFSFSVYFILASNIDHGAVTVSLFDPDPCSCSWWRRRRRRRVVWQG